MPQEEIHTSEQAKVSRLSIYYSRLWKVRRETVKWDDSVNMDYFVEQQHLNLSSQCCSNTMETFH